MASGLPIAGVNVGDVKEMVSIDNRQFIVNRHATALAGAIMELLSAREARRRIGKANQERARFNYGMDRMARSYTELFLSLGPIGYLSNTSDTI